MISAESESVELEFGWKTLTRLAQSKATLHV